MSGPVVRVVSYNVHGLSDDQGALASVMRTLAPDVALVQEGPRRLRWRARTASMARLFGMYYVAGGVPSLGNIIVVSPRVQVHRTWCLAFPLTPGRHLRGAAFAEVSVERVRFVVAGSHLATDDTERPGQAEILKRELREAAGAGPVIFGGDLNEGPGGGAWRTIADGMTDGGAEAGVFTFPISGPRRRIDVVLADERCEVESYEIPDTPEIRAASDHFPVVADLRLPS